MAIRYSEEPKKVSKRAAQDAEMARLAHLPEKEFKAEIAEKLGRGRRPSGNETVTLRVDRRAVEFFKTYGDDWKKVMAEALAKAAFL